jgi:hypothetical protein
MGQAIKHVAGPTAAMPEPIGTPGGGTLCGRARE